MRATYPISNRLHKGFVDVLSLLIVVFLVATIAMGTKLTTDKNFTANFFSQAKKGVPSDYDVKHAAADAQKAKDKAADAVSNAAGADSVAANQKAADALAAAASAAQNAAKVANDKAISTGNAQDIQNATNAINTASTAQFNNNVAQSKVQDTTTTTTTTVPAGKCGGANGIAYNPGDVVVYSSGANDYRKCGTNGLWITDSNLKITDLTVVPTYLQPTYTQAVTDKNAADAASRAQAAAVAKARAVAEAAAAKLAVMKDCTTGGLLWNSKDNTCSPPSNTTTTINQTTEKTDAGNIIHTTTITRDYLGNIVATKTVDANHLSLPPQTTNLGATATGNSGSINLSGILNPSGLNGIGMPSGIGGGNAALTAPNCKAGDTACFQNYQNAVFGGMASGAVVGSTILGGGLLAGALPQIEAGATYAYSYGTAALTTAPAAIQTAIGITGALATVVTPAVLTQNCVASGDPNSASCQAVVGMNVDPIATQQALANSASTLKNAAVSVVNGVLIDQTFASDALQTTGGGTYTATARSQGGTGQRLVINPNNDPQLQEYMQNAQDYLKQNRTSGSTPRVQILNDYVNRSLRYATGDSYDGPTLLRDELYASGTPVNLGEFTSVRTGVCREFAACLHTVLADNGKQSFMVAGDVNSVSGSQTAGEAGRHAWVEYIDTKTGQMMVADPTNGWITTQDQAYNQMYQGVSDIVKQQFVFPSGTPWYQQILQKATGTIKP